MKVVVDDQAGVCAGVKRAIRIVERQLENDGDLLALGSLIHNEREIKRLEEKGLETIDQNDVIRDEYNLKKLHNNKPLLIRTHGIGTKLKSRLQDFGIDLIDATCPTVKRVQHLIEKYYQEGFQIVIVGKAGHPEVEGLQGHCDGEAIVISSDDHVNYVDSSRKTLLVAQTTISQERFKSVLDQLEGKIATLEVRDTTCKIINKRHEYMREFAASHDVVLFVAGKHSSNARVLSDICRSVNERTYLIEDSSEIKSKWLKGAKTVGITGSASTPMWQLEMIKRFLDKNACNGH